MAMQKHGSPCPQPKGPNRSVGVGIPLSRAIPKCATPYPQLIGPPQPPGVGIHYSKSHTESWEPVSPTQREACECVSPKRTTTPKRGFPYPQPKGPNRSMGVRIPHAKSHAKGWDSISPTQGAKPKAWESVSASQGATMKCDSPYPQLMGAKQTGRSPCPQLNGPRESRELHSRNSRAQLKGQRNRVGVRFPNLRGHTEPWKFMSPSQGATQKRESPYPQIKGPRKSVGIRIPNAEGHTEAWE